jgi:hypothetical protein
MAESSAWVSFGGIVAFVYQNFGRDLERSVLSFILDIVDMDVVDIVDMDGSD